MKLKIETILLMMTLCLVSGCERMFMGERIDTNPVVTFDYLWQQVDERYSLFDVKEVDWGAMYDSLRPRVYNDMSDEELFSVCRDLLNSLNDGHVDLWSSTDVASSEAIFLQRYAQNNIDINTVALTYLGPHRHTTGGLTYNSIDSGRVLYIYYGSFSNKASANQMEYAISLYPDIDGIVSIYYDDIVYTVYDNGLIICVIYYNASLTLIYYAHSGILIREKSQIFQISYLIPGELRKDTLKLICPLKNEMLHRAPGKAS